MLALQTPDERFADLADWPYEPKYLEIDGLRMHYVDEGEGEVILCLHGEPSWGYLYRKFIPVLSPHHRVVVPDLFGFGRSDKPTRIDDYSFEFHFNSLVQFVEKMGLKNITVVVQDWGGLLGLSLVGAYPEWFSRLVIMNTFLPIGDRPMPMSFKLWRFFATYSPIFPISGVLKLGTHRKESHRREVMEAYDAPFPSSKYKAGTRAFPAMVPTKPGDPGVAEMKKAREVLAEWQKPCLVMFSDKDPIMGPARRFFADLVPTAQEIPEKRIKNAGHFLQEDAGEEIAGHILDFMG